MIGARRAARSPAWGGAGGGVGTLLTCDPVHPCCTRAGRWCGLSRTPTLILKTGVLTLLPPRPQITGQGARGRGGEQLRRSPALRVASCEVGVQPGDRPAGPQSIAGGSSQEPLVCAGDSGRARGGDAQDV